MVGEKDFEVKVSKSWVKATDGPTHWIVEMTPRRPTMKVMSAVSVDILPVHLSSSASFV